MEFWRVFNWNPNASTTQENGHPLFVWLRQGSGRIDDPEGGYRVLYAADQPEGAVAEAFGRFITWSPDILEMPRLAPTGTVKALAKYRGNPAVLDLDDPSALLEWSLRPSQVVSRDKESTQQWARAIYDGGSHAGVSWWSYYDPQWSSTGLWDISSLTVVEEPVALTLDHPAVQDAASIIRRVITDRRVGG